jgi:hypothetical protein
MNATLVLTLGILLTVSAHADRRPRAESEANRAETAVRKVVDTLDDFLPAGTEIKGAYTINGETDPDSPECTVRVTKYPDRSAIAYEVKLLPMNSEDGDADAALFRVMAPGKRNPANGRKQELGELPQPSAVRLLAQLTEDRQRVNLEVSRVRTQGRTPQPVERNVTSVSITVDGPKRKRLEHKYPKTQTVTETCRFSAN